MLAPEAKAIERKNSHFRPAHNTPSPPVFNNNKYRGQYPFCLVTITSNCLNENRTIITAGHSIIIDSLHCLPDCK